MATKGKKAKAASRALLVLLNENRSIDLAILTIEAGRMSAIDHFSGCLSTKQIEEEIAICSERVPGFAEVYQSELDRK